MCEINTNTSYAYINQDINIVTVYYNTVLYYITDDQY